jgi:DNA-binding NtrC family response regulator
VPASILVVDDEPMVCQVTCRMLREGGYAAEGVYSGRAAIAFLRPDRPYDLFVLDVRLADMSGVTLAHVLAAQYPQCPFLFISGFPESQGDKPPGSRWAFLGKPFSYEQLHDAVRQLLAPSEPAHPNGPPGARFTARSPSRYPGFAAACRSGSAYRRP